MKKLALILISVLALQIVFAVSEQATEQENFKFNSTRMALIINEDKPEIPSPFKNFVGDERVNVYVDEQTLGLIITDGSVQEAKDSALTDPSIEIRTTQQTIDDLYSNKIKPSEALKTKAIEIKGIGAWNGLKVGFLKIGLRMIGGKLDKAVGEKENQNKDKNKNESKEVGENVFCVQAYDKYGDCSKGKCSEGSTCTKIYIEELKSYNCTCKEDETPVEYTCSSKTPPNCALGTCQEGKACSTDYTTGKNNTCSCQVSQQWADANCTDSDSKNAKTKGYVEGWTKDSTGKQTDYKIYDECSDSLFQVNEMWCYNNPEGTGQVHGKIVYTCKNGCKDGACED